MIETEFHGSSWRPRTRRPPPGAAPGTLLVDPGAAAPTIRVIAFDGTAMSDETVADPDELAALTGRRAVTWINVDGLGDAAVLNRIGEMFGLHPLAIEDVINVHQRPKLEAYDDHLFFVTRMPDTAGGTEQVSLFLGKGFVITFQERPGDCFDPVRRRIADNRGRIRSAGADYLAYALLDAATDAFFPLLERHGEVLEELEQEVLDGATGDLRARIHAVKRDLLVVRRAIWPQREMLNQLIRDEASWLDDHTLPYVRDCLDHTFQLIDLVETYREVASDLVDIHLSSMSIKLNEVMQVLTVIATIVLPLTLITGIYGMNFEPGASPWNMPELGWRYGYPFALVLMAAIAVGMLFWFRRRGWLGGRSRRR